MTIMTRLRGILKPTVILHDNTCRPIRETCISCWLVHPSLDEYKPTTTPCLGQMRRWGVEYHNGEMVSGSSPYHSSCPDVQRQAGTLMEEYHPCKGCFGTGIEPVVRPTGQELL